MVNLFHPLIQHHVIAGGRCRLRWGMIRGLASSYCEVEPFNTEFTILCTSTGAGSERQASLKTAQSHPRGNLAIADKDLGESLKHA